MKNYQKIYKKAIFFHNQGSTANHKYTKKAPPFPGSFSIFKL
jgi:hypothetical protein